MGLRHRHQPAVGRRGIRGHVAMRPAFSGGGIGPEAGDGRSPRLAAQQRDRILQIGVEQRVVFDHGGDAGVADHRRAERTQPPERPAATLDQAQRRCRRQQPLHGSGTHRKPCRQRVGGLRPFEQDIEQAQLQAGQQHLRIDEARAHVEQRAGALSGDRPGQGKGRGPALESRVRQQAVAPGAPSAPEQAATEHAGAHTGASGIREIKRHAAPAWPAGISWPRA
jgi:hypothetical protein